MIRYYPSYINTISENDTECPKCSHNLSKINKYETKREMCSSCRSDDRPFNMGSSNDICSCSSYEVMISEISCSNCIINQKKKEEKEILIQNKEFEEEEKREFQNKWNNDPLSTYSVKKLKKLAKKKKIKGFYKMNKKDLLNNLRPLVNNTDFPIR